MGTSVNCPVLNCDILAWTDEEAIKLISLWGEDEIQEQLEGCTRNKVVHEKIAQEMAAAGKFKAEYKRIRDSNNETERSMRSSRYYEKLDEILGHRPATQPEIFLDASAIKDSETMPESENTFEIVRDSRTALTVKKLKRARMHR